MNRPRDRASAAGLLPRMEARPWKDGVTVSYRYHPVGGKPLKLGTDRAAAIQRVAAMLGQQDDAGTVNDLWRQYKVSPYWLRLAPGTHRQYTESSVNLLRVFGVVLAAHIRPADVARYLRVERGQHPTAANHEIALLSVLLRLAAELGWIDRNPCREVARNITTPKRDAPEPEALAAFLAWAGARNGQAVVLAAMAEFSALTGHRRGEFLRATWAAVGDTSIRLMRLKQRRETWEVVEINPALAALLTRMRAFARDTRHGALFPNRQGNPYTDAGFKAMWSKLLASAKAAGAVSGPIRFQSLRGYFATQYKARHGHHADLHRDPGTTARIYDAAVEIRRGSL